MYVTTTLTLQNHDGEEDEYEVGAEVDWLGAGNGWKGTYDVGEPDISAPGCSLKLSRIASDPQHGDVFPEGWSDAIEEALVEVFDAKMSDGPSGPDPDEFTEREEY